MQTTGFIKTLAVQTALPVIAAGLCLMWLVVFADAFKVGMTWSGLNPDGGGPGFLLLVTTGLVSFFGRSPYEKTCSAMRAILIAVCGSIVCGLCLSTLVIFTGTLSEEATPPVVSGVICSYLVPRVVVAVLDDTWKRVDAERRATSSA
ncbi:MAG: hypothetical protein AAGH64_10350 [Planctomycetota bacterium]